MNGTVLLYPSSCSYQEEFQSLPFDNVILNSMSFSRSRKRGKVICTNIDNNCLLGIFKKLRMEITDIVIIRDGCMEGGNYECCASNTFLGKIVGIQTSSFNAYYCHYISRNFNLPAEIQRAEVPEYVSILRTFSDPLGEQEGIEIVPRTFERRKFKLGQIDINLLRESLSANLENYDIVLLPRKYPLQESFKNFAQGQGLDYQNLFYGLNINSDESFADFLEAAKRKKWKRVAILPFENRKYRSVMSLIKNHEGSELREIDFYHLHNSDYRQLYKISRRE